MKIYSQDKITKRSLKKIITVIFNVLEISMKVDRLETLNADGFFYRLNLFQRPSFGRNTTTIDIF